MVLLPHAHQTHIYLYIYKNKDKNKINIEKGNAESTLKKCDIEFGW